MKKLILPFILALLISATAFGQTMVNITFELNVATLGTNVSSTGMYIGGGSGFGGPTDNVMTDQGGGIWTITFQQPAGFNSHYTFLNGDGGWNDKEQLGGLPCGDPNNFNDRYLPWVSQDTTVKACFGTCDSDGSCSIVTDSVNITFMVNTSNIMVDPAGLFLAGGGVFGNPGDNAMTDMNGDGVYEITVRKPKGFGSDYTFTNGFANSWGDKEVITGMPCAVAPFDDRNLPAVYSDTTLMTCFATCSSDTSCFSMPPPAKMNPDLPITFEDTATVDYNLVDFGNIAPSMIVVDPTDATNLVVETTKSAGSETWAGTVLGDGGLVNPIPFTSADKKMSVRVWSPTANTPIRLKVEDVNDGANVFAEVDVNTTMAGAWETLEFDFSAPVGGGIDVNNTYNKVVIFYDFGTAGTDATYYCDDVMFVAPAVTQAKPSLPITFEDTIGVNYNFADFGGTYATPSMVVVDPTDPNNLVAQTTKPSGSETWAGTVLGGDGLTSAIPFTAANQKMYVDVWSPAANTPILLKVEDAADGNIAAEVLATTTTASTWETLEFDLANSSTNAIDLANTYNKIAIFYNFGTAGADETYYCDNVSYGSPYTSTNGLEVDNNLFTVQPNLVRDYVNITFGENAINTEKQLTVVNAIGQVVENRTINNDQVYTLDATRYANGLYFVSIRTENAILTQKFVVSK